MCDSLSTLVVAHTIQCVVLRWTIATVHEYTSSMQHNYVPCFLLGNYTNILGTIRILHIQECRWSCNIMWHWLFISDAALVFFAWLTVSIAAYCMPCYPLLLPTRGLVENGSNTNYEYATPVSSYVQWLYKLVIRWLDRMAGNFGGEFILADWWFWDQSANISSAKTLQCDVIIIAKS